MEEFCLPKLLAASRWVPLSEQRPKRSRAKTDTGSFKKGASIKLICEIAKVN